MIVSPRFSSRIRRGDSIFSSMSCVVAPALAPVLQRSHARAMLRRIGIHSIRIQRLPKDQARLAMRAGIAG